MESLVKEDRKAESRQPERAPDESVSNGNTSATAARPTDASATDSVLNDDLMEQVGFTFEVNCVVNCRNVIIDIVLGVVIYLNVSKL